MRPAAKRVAVVVLVALLLVTCGVWGAVPRPPAVAPAMLLGSNRVTSTSDVMEEGVQTGDGGGGRQLAGADEEEEEDYGYVDPPPDTNRRGAGAPIPHN